MAAGVWQYLGVGLTDPSGGGFTADAVPAAQVAIGSPDFYGSAVDWSVVAPGWTFDVTAVRLPSALDRWTVTAAAAVSTWWQFDVSGAALELAADDLYTVTLSPPGTWPTNDDFRAYLGLDPSDTADLEATQAALDAAQVDAVAVGATYGPADERARTAQFGLARLYLNARSQPETWAPGSPTAIERAGWRRLLAGARIGAV